MLRPATLRIVLPGITGLLWLAMASVRALMMVVLGLQIARSAARRNVWGAVTMLVAVAAGATYLGLTGISGPAGRSEVAIELRGTLPAQQ